MPVFSAAEKGPSVVLEKRRKRKRQRPIRYLVLKNKAELSRRGVFHENIWELGHGRVSQKWPD